MVSVCGTASSEHYSITARPNASLATGGCLLVFSIITLLTLGIALIFAILGAWPVLMFAIIELCTLAWAFHAVLLHARDYERLTINGYNILLEQHEPNLDQRVELNGYWAKLVLDYMPDGDCRRLALRSHGREIEFGHYLSSEERLALAQQLRGRLGGFLS